MWPQLGTLSIGPPGGADTPTGAPSPLLPSHALHSQPYPRRERVIPQEFRDLGEGGGKRAGLFLVACRSEEGVRGSLGLGVRVCSRALGAAGDLQPRDDISFLFSGTSVEQLP